MREYLLVFFVVSVFFFIVFFSAGIFMDLFIIPTIIYTRLEEWIFDMENVDFLLHVKRSFIISVLVAIYITLSR